MMIGIEFERENAHDNFLNELFYDIDLNNFVVDISEDEVYYNDYNLETDKIYQNGEFKSGSYILFINLKIYPKNNNNYEEIKSYEDFIKSDCQLIVLINDVVFVEIYFKDEFLKETILNNLDKKKIKYDIKTLSNDSRYIMSVV